jgi:hypothetical protein
MVEKPALLFHRDFPIITEVVEVWRRNDPEAFVDQKIFKISVANRLFQFDFLGPQRQQSLH